MNVAVLPANDTCSTAGYDSHSKLDLRETRERSWWP